MIEERPASVLAVHALRTGLGRVWRNDDAVLVEPLLVAGEPLAFGAPDAILDLLEQADGWTCVEVDAPTAAAMRAPFDRRWGLARTVTDVVHVLDEDPPPLHHPLVVPIDGGVADPEALLPETVLLAQATAVFGAVEAEVLRGVAGSYAAGERFADVGVHVAASHRRQGIASAAAAAVCRAVRGLGLVPVWGCGAHNEASMRTAAALGFREVERLTYLVRR